MGPPLIDAVTLNPERDVVIRDQLKLENGKRLIA